MKPQIAHTTLTAAATQGMDAFLDLIVKAIKAQAATEELSAEAFARLLPDHITLWGYITLRDELCDGGFIQLIHNGYGPFFFLNPFAKAMRLWGLKDFSKYLYKARELYEAHGERIATPCSDEEFMALYEQYPAFEDLDDEFMEQEEQITTQIAHYVDEHLTDFIDII